MSTPPDSDETIFAGALAQPASERAAFLDQACAGDPARRARIESLLHAHEAAEAQFMATAATPARIVEPAAGETIGRYRLLQKLAKSGCVVVYLAEQQEPVVRRVAVQGVQRRSQGIQPPGSPRAKRPGRAATQRSTEKTGRR